MPPPDDSSKTGGRLSGPDVRDYLQAFAGKFLQGDIRYSTNVLHITRVAEDVANPWRITVQASNNDHASVEVLEFSKVVLCSGVRSLVYC